MKPAATEPEAGARPAPAVAGDPFPSAIRVERQRRRTIELSLQDGEMVARVPRRISRAELEEALPALRAKLWRQLRRRSAFDQQALQRRAEQVAKTLLGDLDLPAFSAAFSRRQQRRWGSCAVVRGRDGRPRGRIWLSARLVGHPGWVLDHLLVHELAHLVVSNHGERFQQLMRRSPRFERAEGYLEALEQTEQLGGLYTRCDLPEPVELEPAATVAGAPPTQRKAPARSSAPAPLPLFAALTPER